MRLIVHRQGIYEAAEIIPDCISEGVSTSMKLCGKFFKTVVAVILIAGTSAPAPADIKQIGPNLYAAGVQTMQFATAAQKSQNWCWAACIEMVLKYHGVNVSQEAVVERIYGQKRDGTGDPWQILLALSGWGPNVSGGASRIYAEGYPGLFPYFIQDLINGYPLIVGLNYGTDIGHAVVLTAVSFSTNQFGQRIPHSVVIRDPWPNNPDRQEMPIYAFVQGCFFSARVAAYPY
jgi:hypothetical protein